MDTFRRIRIGEVLIEYGYITPEQLEAALANQKENPGKLLGTLLEDMGFITEKQKLMALGQKLNLSIIDISEVTVNTEAVAKLPRQLAEKYRMLPLAVRDGILVIATDEPLNYYGIEDVRQVTGMQIEIVLCERAVLERAIQYYYSEVSARQMADRANLTDMNVIDEDITEDEGDEDTVVISLLNSLLERAVITNASDVHVEPYEKKILIRMRLDGAITDFMTLQKKLHNSLIARIKILSDLDIAERRVPQDGHFRIRIHGEMTNIRVSLIPTVFGEKAVLRVLAGNSSIDYQDSYGMNKADHEKFSSALNSPNGIIYLTGPTGSGKTTTLYMILQDMVKRNVNISTIEDPVEKNLDRVNQMQVNNMAGLTFEAGLRALLRQDPDIIMVGETRDAQTANISVRAAITGHLVFSTLHTNDAASSVVRLIDMELEPYMIANSLVCIVAQRLMRKVCPECGRETEPTEQERAFLGRDVKTVKYPGGCNYCNSTGYRGRTAIHEILLVDKAIRKMISNRATTEEIKQYAIQNQGMKTLKDCAVDLVAAGVTTMEELMKVAYYD